MAKRKSKRKLKPTKRWTAPLDTVFTCPFCNHEKSCEVTIDRQRRIGQVTCTICSEDYRTDTHYLSEKIDIYNAWIDACEDANRE